MGEQIITRDMKIAKAIKVFPELSSILAEFDIHCYHCPISNFESLGQGLLSHARFTEEQVTTFIEEINEYIRKKK